MHSGILEGFSKIAWARVYDDSYVDIERDVIIVPLRFHVLLCLDEIYVIDRHIANTRVHATAYGRTSHRGC